MILVVNPWAYIILGNLLSVSKFEHAWKVRCADNRSPSSVECKVSFILRGQNCRLVTPGCQCISSQGRPSFSIIYTTRRPNSLFWSKWVNQTKATTKFNQGHQYWTFRSPIYCCLYTLCWIQFYRIQIINLRKYIFQIWSHMHFISCNV